MQKLIDTVELLIDGAVIKPPCFYKGMCGVVISGELLYKANVIVDNILDGNTPDDGDYNGKSIAILLDAIGDLYQYSEYYPLDQYGAKESIVAFNYFNDLIIAFDNIWE